MKFVLQQVSANNISQDRVRKDYTTLQSKLSSLQLHHDTRLAELEAKNTQIHDAHAERDNALRDVERLRSDFRNVTRELGDYKSRNSDLTTLLDARTKEVTHSNERIRVFEHESAEFLYEKGRLEDELKRANARHGDAIRDLEQWTDKYNTLQRDTNNLRSTLHTTELERDEHVTTLDRLRIEIKDKNTRIGIHEAHVADLNSRLQKSQRDATTADEKVSHITIELQTTKTRKQ